jgi:hypothetical protein
MTPSLSVQLQRLRHFDNSLTGTLHPGNVRAVEQLLDHWDDLETTVARLTLTASRKDKRARLFLDEQRRRIRARLHDLLQTADHHYAGGRSPASRGSALHYRNLPPSNRMKSPIKPAVRCSALSDLRKSCQA